MWHSLPCTICQKWKNLINPTFSIVKVYLEYKSLFVDLVCCILFQCHFVCFNERGQNKKWAKGPLMTCSGLPSKQWEMELGILHHYLSLTAWNGNSQRVEHLALMQSPGSFLWILIVFKVRCTKRDYKLHCTVFWEYINTSDIFTVRLAIIHVQE